MAVSRFNPDYPDAGLVQIVPTSIVVGSGSGSTNGNGTITFSGASSISLNGIFNATYNFYKLVIAGTSSGDVGFSGRYRVAGVDETGSNYSMTGVYTNNAAGPSRTNSAGATATEIGTLGANGFGCEVTFFNPFSTSHKKTYISHSFANYASDRDNRMIGGQYNATNSYDGITLYPSSGTFTGSLQVYGYRN